jgi:hypothetical protein
MTRPPPNPTSLKIMTINVPRRWLPIMDRMVEAGMFPSRSELFRFALYDFLYHNEGFVVMEKLLTHLDPTYLPIGAKTEKEAPTQMGEDYWYSRAISQGLVKK